nr:hypothetical protein CFP56_47467 [Quercus suber]
MGAHNDSFKPGHTTYTDSRCGIEPYGSFEVFLITAWKIRAKTKQVELQREEERTDRKPWSIVRDLKPSPTLNELTTMIKRLQNHTTQTPKDKIIQLIGAANKHTFG